MYKLWKSVLYGIYGIQQHAYKHSKVAYNTKIACKYKYIKDTWWSCHAAAELGILAPILVHSRTLSGHRLKENDSLGFVKTNSSSEMSLI